MPPFPAPRALYGPVIAAIALMASDAVSGPVYPDRPIHMVVPASAGAGVIDIMARLVGHHLSARLGQQIVVDNRPGASGIVGTEVVAKAAPDGHTLLLSNVALVVTPLLYARLPYDPLTDFVPVTRINAAPLVLVVHPSLAATSVTALIAAARFRPGELNYGSGGVGSTPYLAAELFKSLSGIDALHVPYKGGAPALSDLVGGQLSFMIENVPGTMPYVRAGHLRALAVTTLQRSPLAPALPTMAEAGVPGYEISGWNGVFAVKGTPAEIVTRLHDEIAEVLHTPEVTREMAALGAEPIGDTPAEFARFLEAETARWDRIIRDRGLAVHHD